MLIYGIREKANFYRWGVIPVPVKENHSELLLKCSKIKKCNVGIEAIDNFRVKFGNILFETSQIYRELYEKLKENNKMIFLDEGELYEEYGKLIERIEMGKLPSVEDLKARIEAEYIYKNKRNQKILEKIEKEQVEIAFVGAAHAFYIHNKNKDVKVFVEYPANEEELAEYIDDVFKFSPNDKILEERLNLCPELNYNISDIERIPEQYLDNIKKAVLEMYGIERLHNLIRHGKIENERKPDFIGTWSVCLHPAYKDVPLRGFFEVFLDEKIIKDCLGDAKFEGIISEKKVEFKKRYTKKFPLFRRALEGEILYKGSFPIKIGGYEAIFGRYGHPKDEGGFFLITEYSEEKAKTIINCSDLAEIMQANANWK